MTQLKPLKPPPDMKRDTVQGQGDKVASADQRRGNPKTPCQPHPDSPATVLISTAAGMVSWPAGPPRGTLSLIFPPLA